MEQERKPEGTPFDKMTRKRKVIFILKLVVCIMTFGMAFPHVMSD
jgi:hypothetical protein